MPRKPMTDADRTRNVVDAFLALDDVIARAQRVAAALSDDEVCDCDAGHDGGLTERECGCKARKAWEAVEVHGATIHRQARLLAGKSKGG